MKLGLYEDNYFYIKFNNKNQRSHLINKFLLLLLCILIGTTLVYSNKIKTKQRKNNSKINIYLSFEYPYTCGTWFNRGKEVCSQIKEILEKNSLNVISSVKAFHQGEFPQGYNGEFNINLNNNGQNILIATSDSNSQNFHQGLKDFAYTYYETDPKTGERNYLAVNPQRADLLKFILNRVLETLKNTGLASNFKNYFDD